MDIKIRPWKMEDAPDLARSVNNKKIQDNMRDGMPFPYTLADAEEYLSAMRSADPNTTYVWAITIDDVAIGNVGIFRKGNIYRLTAELGYYIAEEYWGRGIVTEAVKQACRYIFEHTDIVRISADPFSWNAGSCRVLEKAGFVFEGLLRQNAIKNGVILDMKLYALVKEGSG